MQVQNFIDGKIDYNKAQINALHSEIAELEAQKSKNKSKNGIEKWIGFQFESSSGLTDEFAQFAREFKKHILGVLPSGSELVSWSRGHFEVTGFVKRDNKFVYFSISDVRHFQNSWYEDILIRTAQHDKDYTGGSNCSTALPNFTEQVEHLLNF